MKYDSTRTSRNALYRHFHRWEPRLFLIFAVYNLLPVFGVDYFLTGDGPAHLYNAHLIQQLIADPEGFASNYFYVRTWLIPNLGGHIFLTLALYVFNPAMAEKLLYGISIIGFIAGFRYYVRSIDHSFGWVAWFALFLVHNFTFYIGFQSFSLALGIMFFLIGAWHRGLLFAKWGSAAITAIAFVLLAICHVVPLVIVYLYIVVGESMRFLQTRMLHLQRAAFAILGFLPAMLFVGYYFLTAEKGSPGQIPDFLMYSYNLAAATALVTVDWSERIYVIVFQLVLLASFVPVLLSFRKIKTVLIPASVCTVLLVMYYLLPDSMATGGFVSIRLMLFVYIFASVVTGTLQGNNKAAPALVLILGGLNIAQVWYHFETSQKLSNDAKVVMVAGEHLKPNTVMVPLNYSHHWLHYNIGLYPGAFNEIVVLDNYEASKAAFPLAWTGDMNPGKRLGDFGFSKTPIFHLEPYESKTGGRIDYVIRFGYSSQISDGNTLETNRELQKHFRLIVKDEQQRIELWERKPNLQIGNHPL
jgi:hypothetical protein